MDKNLKTIPGTVLFYHYEMLDQTQEMKVRRDILDAKDFMLTIKY